MATITPETDVDAPRSRNKLPLRRRVLFAVVLTLCLVALTEVLCYVACLLAVGPEFSFARMHAQQDELSHMKIATTMQRAVEAGNHVDDEVIHPYVGYVRSPKGEEGNRRLGFEEDGELLHARRPDRVIVLILGGSLANGFFASQKARLEQDLPTIPRFAGKSILVLNASVGGYKQPQQLMALNYLLALGGEFDVVVNIDGFNEVALHQAENAPKNVAPIFPRSWYMRSRTMTDSVALSLAGHMAFLKVQRKRWSKNFTRLPYRYSPTLNAVWLLRDRRLHREYLETETLLRNYQPEASEYVSTGPQRGVLTGDPLFEELGAIWQRRSAQMHALAEAGEFRYLHFLQPNQYVRGSKVLTAEERREAFLETHPYRPGVELGYPVLTRRGRELRTLGVAFRDLTQMFRDVPETVYRDTCCHLNARGHELLGRRVVEALR